jgi:hypothetical protein
MEALMPIVSTSFIIADDQETGLSILDKCADCDFIVLRLSSGGFRVAAPQDLRRILLLWSKLQSVLAEVPAQAFQKFQIKSIDLDSPEEDDERKVDSLETGQVMLVLEGGQPSAVLVGEKHERAISKGAGTPARFINTWMKDRRDELHDPRVKPLDVEQIYSLSFDVDIRSRPESIASDQTFEGVFEPGEERMEITVRLVTSDFELLDGAEKKLLVPAVGPSRNIVTFSLAPRQAGLLVLNAIFLKGSNFIQMMTFKFQAGADQGPVVYQREDSGRAVNSASSLEDRQISLMILNQGGSYQVLFNSPEPLTAVLPLKPADIEMMARETRAALQSVVTYNYNGKLVYQVDVRIPEAVSEKTLRVLAEAGCRLYQRMFIDSGDSGLLRIADRMQQVLSNGQCKVQVFTQDFVLPWSLLYLAERIDPTNIDPQKFLGMAHIVEHIPLQKGLLNTPTLLDGSSGLDVSLSLNTDIDSDSGYAYAGKQEQYWQDLRSRQKKIRTIVSTTVDEVTHLLNDPATAAEILYFYCHGISTGFEDQGGTDASALLFTKNGRLTLRNLRLYSPVSEKLAGRPLVFINGCETARLSPLVSDGFVTYFMSKGARGVIGTECKIPLYFALIWATRFFDRLLAGETLVEVFFHLRQEFYQKDHNILGLLYSLYADCDTRLQPALLPVGG